VHKQDQEKFHSNFANLGMDWPINESGLT